MMIRRLSLPILVFCISLIRTCQGSSCYSNHHQHAAFLPSKGGVKRKNYSCSLPLTGEALTIGTDAAAAATIRVHKRQNSSGSSYPRHQTQLQAFRRSRRSQFSFLSASSEESGERKKMRQRVKRIARGLVAKPMAYASNVVPMPAAIASVLKEASFAAVEQVEYLVTKEAGGSGATTSALEESKIMMLQIIDEAFAPMEQSLDEMEDNLARARKALKKAKSQSTEAIEAIQVAAIAQAEGAATAVAQAERVAERQVITEIYSSGQDVDVSNLSFEDVDFDSSEMAPPFLDPDSCLVPGEPVVRVEKAPENSRRIFAGVDIMASVDDVWKVSF
jgi:hypothetical protein